jgi:hypothetical protein
MKAINIGETYWCRGDVSLAGDLYKYNPKRKMAQHMANLNMVPYYVMKKPSDPSLIGSPMSYIALVPVSLSRIQHSIHSATMIKHNEMTRAEKAIMLEVV